MFKKKHACPACGRQVSLKDIGKGVKEKAAPKWYGVSHQYTDKKCPLCNVKLGYRLDTLAIFLLASAFLIVVISNFACSLNLCRFVGVALAVILILFSSRGLKLYVKE